MANNATVFLTGNLTYDPTMANINGQSQLRFKMAVSTAMKKADNSGYEANFYDVTYWGKPAEYAAARLQKGTMVEVVGDLSVAERMNERTGKMDHYLNVRAMKVTPLLRMKQNGQQGTVQQATTVPQAEPTVDNTGLPF